MAPGRFNLIGEYSDYAARFNPTPGVFVLDGNLEAGPVSLH